MNLEHLPVEIRESRRCVVWCREWRGGRATKVPYMATRPGHRAAVDDPTTWCPFPVAWAVVQMGHGAGVGVVLGDELAGVDLDHVRLDETGLVTDDAMSIVHALNSYTEVSPSGTGLHVLASGTLPPGRRRRGFVEMYDAKRFFTVTGRHVAGTPWTIEERTAALAALHARYLGVPAAPPPCPAPPVIGTMTDPVLLARAHAARNGANFAALWRGDTTRYPSPSEADLALCAMLVYWTGGDAARVDLLFRASGLMRPKWDAPRGERTYGAHTIAIALGGRR
jgi:putative DNA primase/helicase